MCIVKPSPKAVSSRIRPLPCGCVFTSYNNLYDSKKSMGVVIAGISVGPISSRRRKHRMDTGFTEIMAISPPGDCVFTPFHCDPFEIRFTLLFAWTFQIANNEDSLSVHKLVIFYYDHLKLKHNISLIIKYYVLKFGGFRSKVKVK